MQLVCAEIERPVKSENERKREKERRKERDRERDSILNVPNCVCLNIIGAHWLL